MSVILPLVWHEKPLNSRIVTLTYHALTKRKWNLVERHTTTVFSFVPRGALAGEPRPSYHLPTHAAVLARVGVALVYIWKVKKII